MDEVIGAKGGTNDRRRTIKISLRQKIKLQKVREEKETKKLAEEVKKKQVFVLIRTIPIVLSGRMIQVLNPMKPT